MAAHSVVVAQLVLLPEVLGEVVPVILDLLALVPQEILHQHPRHREILEVMAQVLHLIAAVAVAAQVEPAEYNPDQLVAKEEQEHHLVLAEVL